MAVIPCLGGRGVTVPRRSRLRRRARPARSAGGRSGGVGAESGPPQGPQAPKPAASARGGGDRCLPCGRRAQRGHRYGADHRAHQAMRWRYREALVRRERAGFADASWQSRESVAVLGGEPALVSATGAGPANQEAASGRPAARSALQPAVPGAIARSAAPTPPPTVAAAPAPMAALSKRTLSLRSSSGRY